MNQPGSPTIHGFSMSTSVICGCGHPEPIHIPFIAGMNVTVNCKACGGELFIAQFVYHYQEPDKMGIGVAYKPPTILRPKIELVKD